MELTTILKQAAKTKNLSARQKLLSLYKKQKLIQEIKTCTNCHLHYTRKNAVPWSGPVPAFLAVLGEGPGVREDEQGKPFVGPAGQLLNKLLKEIGLDRDKIFIFNTICCRPPMNQTPAPVELAACEKFFHAQLNISEAKLVVLLGAAALSIFKPGEAVGAWRGRWFTIDNRVFLSTYHPAAALRSPDRLKDMRTDFQVLKKLAQPFVRSKITKMQLEATEYIFRTCPEHLNPSVLPSLWEKVLDRACYAHSCRNLYLLEAVLEKWKKQADGLAKFKDVPAGELMKRWSEVVEVAARIAKEEC